MLTSHLVKLSATYHRIIYLFNYIISGINLRKLPTKFFVLVFVNLVGKLSEVCGIKIVVPNLNFILFDVSINTKIPYANEFLKNDY